MAATALLARPRQRTNVPTAPAIYARISADAEQRGLGVARQVADCHELLERKGWPAAAGSYVDNDISASRKRGRTAHRPEWERLLADVEGGAVDAVVAWELDRLCRDPLEQEQFFLACERAGVHYVATFSDEVDIVSGEGMMMARIKGAVNAEEARKIAKRVMRKKVEIAEKGAPAGGPRPFGFEPDQATIREDEAALIRSAAARILAGESITGICRSWTAEGRTTARGLEWRAQTLRDILRSPRVAGLRQHQGEVIGEASWPAIIDRATWERVSAAIQRPDRKGLRPTSHLLSGGLLRCRRCGSAMSTTNVSGRRRYRCFPGPGLPGCGGVTIVAEELEELIVEAAMQRLDSSTLAARVDATAEDEASAAAAAQLADDERRLLELSDLFADGDISRAEWLRQRERIERRIGAARGVLHQRAAVDVLDGLDGGRLRELWAAFDVDRQRAILAALIERIVVAPARKGVPHFDAERLDIEWRDRP